MIDALRARYPGLGFALYAIEPGPVTLEVYDGDDVFTFRGATSEDALAEAGLSLGPTEAPEEPADVFG